ncbi:hypothetical protein [Nocardia grenadensis]
MAATLDDFRAAVLPTPVRDRAALSDLVRDRQPDVVDRTAWTGPNAPRTRRRDGPG